MTGRPRRSPPLVLLGLGALVCFGLGLLVARRAEAPVTIPSPAATASSRPARVPSSAEPQILIDPSRVELLPDASLQLELPAFPDAGPR